MFSFDFNLSFLPAFGDPGLTTGFMMPLGGSRSDHFWASACY